MDIRTALLGIAFAAFAADALAQSAEPPAAVNVEGLPTHVRVRILEKAQQGETAVIRYLHRTYTVHGLRPENVLREQQPMFASGKSQVKVAGAEDTAKK